MAKNRIQFQPGISLSKFLARYGTDAKCRRVLFNLKWPGGFSCPRCHHAKYFLIKRHYRYQCQNCQHQTTATVGTILQSTKVPVRHWFYAAYLMTQSKNSISSMSLKRMLGVDYKTAWRIKHKLIMAVQQSENKQRLSGIIQIDDAYIGGRKRGGKRGRGAGKTPFVAAISMINNKPFKVKLTRVASFKQRDIAAWAKQHIKAGAIVLSDGMPGFKGLQQADLQHTSIKTTGNKQAQDVIFRWVNTILGNVKRAIDGTYHAIRRSYINRYLALFQFRFNHRFDLNSMMDKTIRLFINTAPISAENLFC